eukprot:TRINITY_DN254_c0_g3_i1.p1 TRINITY_DN254_c0_g3~~TRINITY_DN254_c0_g3_i1.p1  ORF type:complete len:202 (-),score=25.04 TRINITY_DN254_c0_g3_i1:24-629(-)
MCCGKYPLYGPCPGSWQYYQCSNTPVPTPTPTPKILPYCPPSINNTIGGILNVMPEGIPGTEIDFVACGFLNFCSTGSEGNCKGFGCCSICQRWQVGGPNPGGACLGVINQAQVLIGDNSVTIIYTGGDIVVDPNDPNNNGPRITYFYLQCGTHPLANLVYTDASVINPNHKMGQPWVYNINGTSIYACNSYQKHLWKLNY